MHVVLNATLSPARMRRAPTAARDKAAHLRVGPALHSSAPALHSSAPKATACETNVLLRLQKKVREQAAELDALQRRAVAAEALLARPFRNGDSRLAHALDERRAAAASAKELRGRVAALDTAVAAAQDDAAAARLDADTARQEAARLRPALEAAQAAEAGARAAALLAEGAARQVTERCADLTKRCDELAQVVAADQTLAAQLRDEASASRRAADEARASCDEARHTDGLRLERLEQTLSAERDAAARDAVAAQRRCAEETHAAVAAAVAQYTHGSNQRLRAETDRYEAQIQSWKEAACEASRSSMARCAAAEAHRAAAEEELASTLEQLAGASATARVGATASKLQCDLDRLQASVLESLALEGARRTAPDHAAPPHYHDARLGHGAPPPPPHYHDARRAPRFGVADPLFYDRPAHYHVNGGHHDRVFHDAPFDDAYARRFDGRPPPDDDSTARLRRAQARFAALRGLG